jgi:RNA polymerase sigma-70 factor, ECF subfamily
MSDTIEALKSGDPGALDRFYRDHAEQVLGWVIRLGGLRVDAEDTAHEVFHIALKKMQTFRGDSSVTTWLYAITRNVVRNARRKAALWRMVGLGEDTETLPARGELADDELIRMRRRRLVQRALERMKAGQREVLVLCDMEGRSAPEVGVMMGIPSGTVYSRLHYSRKQFAKALQQERMIAENRAAQARGAQ